MTPQQALKKLTSQGMTQAQIVDALKAKGVSITQPAISRIASGSRKNTGFELGTAIVSLAAGAGEKA